MFCLFSFFNIINETDIFLIKFVHPEDLNYLYIKILLKFIPKQNIIKNNQSDN